MDAILSGVISSTTTRLIKSGTGTLALTAANTYGIALGPGVVGTTVSAGVLQIGNGGTLGSIGAGSDINNNATLAFNRSDAFTLANNITGTGAVRQIGGGTTTLSGISTYTGPTTVAAGTLEISGSINGSNSVSVTNGALTLSNSNAVNDNAALILGNATLTVGGTSEFVGNNSASATAAGVGSLTVTSSSTIDFVAGSSTLWFSSLTSVIGTLSITNWSGNSSLGGGADQLRFTTDPGAFLGQISFAGAPAAGQIFFANGGNPYFEVVPIPEPSSTALMALATLCAFGSFRRVSRSRAACSEVISEQVPILWEAEL